MVKKKKKEKTKQLILKATCLVQAVFYLVPLVMRVLRGSHCHKKTNNNEANYLEDYLASVSCDLRNLTSYQGIGEACKFFRFS
ncbi:hypothetical protein HanRHA438_Chr07g0306291 [Helianthus annuus]|nr:hypothetical protein HanIR_Chr07g0319561 [Helianthus annuus]KAJ0908069.1 hypothetical protein HanRHA438_Chr07g0306291 [Helianthus annuus]